MDGLTILPEDGGAWNLWRCYRLPAAYHSRNAWGGGQGIPVAARDMIRRAFERLTGPQEKEDNPPFRWGLCDCMVNGVPSMAITAIFPDERAIPVMVMPVGGMQLRNWCGDVLFVRENSLLQHPTFPESAESSARRMLTSAPGPCPPGLRNKQHKAKDRTK